MLYKRLVHPAMLSPEIAAASATRDHYTRMVLPCTDESRVWRTHTCAPARAGDYVWLFVGKIPYSLLLYSRGKQRRIYRVNADASACLSVCVRALCSFFRIILVLFSYYSSVKNEEKSAKWRVMKAQRKKGMYIFRKAVYIDSFVRNKYIALGNVIYQSTI